MKSLDLSDYLIKLIKNSGKNKMVSILILC